MDPPADPVLSNNADHDGITVHAAPVAYPASNSPVCDGATIYLFGGPGGMTSYSWTGPAGFNSNQQNPVIHNATLAMAGTYSLTVVDSTGCGSAGNTTDVTVTQCCCICGFVYRAGTTDPLVGWEIVLEKEINSWEEVGRVTTDANGKYCFCGLDYDVYRVSEVVQPGWNQILPSSAVYVVTLPLYCCDPLSGPFILNFENQQDPAGSTVGWQASPVDKLVVLAPWIMLLAAIVAGTSLLVLRRRRA